MPLMVIMWKSVTSDSASNDWLCQWLCSAETETANVDKADTGQSTGTLLNTDLSACQEMLQILTLSTTTTFIKSCNQFIYHIHVNKNLKLLHFPGRYSRSKLNVVWNRAKFWPAKFYGAFPMNCAHLNTPALRHVARKSFVTLFPLAPKL